MKNKPKKLSNYIKVLKSALLNLFMEAGLFQLTVACTFLMLIMIWILILAQDIITDNNNEYNNINKNKDVYEFPAEYLHNNEPKNDYNNKNKNLNELSPEHIFLHNPKKSYSEVDEKKDFICFFTNLIRKISSRLSFYFHIKNGLSSVIISLMYFIIFTVVIVYLRYKGFAFASIISDLIFIRWLEFFPQFFLLLISFHIIDKNMDSADKRMPFIWTLVICWTLGPYIYRQLQPVVTSFFKSRVYDAEILIGEKKWKIFFNYLICQHCFTLILVLTCFVFGNLILIESCMAYLVNFSNQGEFPSLGGSLSNLFKAHSDGKHGWELYLNIPLEAIMTLYFIFAGVIFFIVAGKLIQIVQNEFKQVLWEK